MTIEKLCKTYTYLGSEDVHMLERVAEGLPYICKLVEADIFLDCLTKDSDKALVLAEANPENTLYAHSVVGAIANRKNEPAVLRTLETGIATKAMKAVTQENKQVKQDVVPIKNKEDKVIGVLIMERDVTDDLEQQKNYEILTEATEQLSQALIMSHAPEGITHYVNDGIIIFNAEGYAIYANPVAIWIYEKLGYLDDVKGMHFDNLSLRPKAFEELLAQPFKYAEDLEIGPLSLNIKYSSIMQEGKVVSLVMLIKDETQEKEIEKALILRSVATQEIHHRVKNNLQTIASLLRLQSRRIGDEAVKKAFNESISRILSISLTHEILAQNGVDDIDIKEILKKLLTNTLDYARNTQVAIQVEVIGDGFPIDSDKATSIALVVNELVQNAIEYAFVGRETGRIVLEIQQGDIYSSITISDDGIGFDQNSVRSGSLGYNIVRSIVSDKLKGQLKVDTDSTGTRVSFDFKNE